MFRIGIISDTHGLLRPEAERRLTGVDHIVHAGDSGRVGRLFAGEAGVVTMTELRGSSNAKAKREIAWRPAHPSWREGFAEVFAT
jgi:predicted phosphodiesterase